MFRTTVKNVDPDYFDSTKSRSLSAEGYTEIIFEKLPKESLTVPGLTKHCVDNYKYDLKKSKSHSELPRFPDDFQDSVASPVQLVQSNSYDRRNSITEVLVKITIRWFSQLLFQRLSLIRVFTSDSRQAPENDIYYHLDYGKLSRVSSRLPAEPLDNDKQITISNCIRFQTYYEICSPEIDFKYFN